MLKMCCFIRALQQWDVCHRVGLSLLFIIYMFNEYGEYSYQYTQVLLQERHNLLQNSHFAHPVLCE